MPHYPLAGPDRAGKARPGTIISPVDPDRGGSATPAAGTFSTRTEKSLPLLRNQFQV
ncbi:hypothetical protein [Mycobacterium sp.]|uniref:hypothetical protein n=1 Tax=Mycobacterium sp. TaxID=1785 RepID=UPI003C7165CF